MTLGVCEDGTSVPLLPGNLSEDTSGAILILRLSKRVLYNPLITPHLGYSAEYSEHMMPTRWSLPLIHPFNFVIRASSSSMEEAE